MTLLTDHLPLLAGAPDGIKKLRELILELAVRGKLVAQDPSDEPAEELLGRLALKTPRAKDAGKKLIQQEFQSIDEKQKTFEIPDKWIWVRFGQVAQHNSGKTLDNGRNSGVLRDYITTSNLYWGYFKLENVRQMLIREDELERCTARKGDLLICEGGEAGRAAVWELESEVCFQNHIHRARLRGDLVPRFFYRMFERLKATGEIDQYRKGVGISNMSGKSLASIIFPLPPVAEQHRIVAKVDELMALCDTLESQQASAESAHVQLVQALLDSLTQASDADDFAANWQRLSKHFDTLFTTEASIEAFKQALLQLAVLGKLVPQESSDEPACAFLKKHGIPSKTHPLRGWAYVQFGSLGEIIGGSTPSKANAEFWGGDMPWVSPKDMKRPLIEEAKDHITAKALDETSLKIVPPNSLLMVVRGMILAHSFPVALTAREVTINQDMKALLVPDEISSYMLMYLQAVKSVMVGLVDQSSHGTCKLLSEKLWSHIVCLPPLAEQRRICATIEQLMSIVNRTSICLKDAEAMVTNLLESLVSEISASENTPSSSVSAKKGRE